MATGSLFTTVIVAGSGGVVIIVGLLMETFSEREVYKNAWQLRRLKRVKYWGGWLVTLGVLIEVVLAGLTAANEWRNDPLKKPVARASAVMRLIIETKSNMTPLFRTNSDYPAFSAGISFFTQEASNAVLWLKSDGCSLWNMGSSTKRECRAEFHEDTLDFLDTELKRSKTPVKQFGKVNSFILRLPEMDTNAVVVSGTVFLNVNDSTFQYEVPRQKPKWGLVTMQMTRGKRDHEAVEIRPVPVTDFVIPPRFPTQMYDGK